MSLSSDLKKHQVTVERLAAKQRKLIEAELEQVRRRASIEIISGSTGNQLKQNLRAATQGLVDNSLNNLLEVAEKESAFIARRVKGVEAITKDELQNKLLSENMRLNLGSQEKTRKSLQTSFSQFGRRKADEITQIIRDGQALGLDPIEIMKNVDERIAGMHMAQARKLSHTSTLYTSNVAQRETILHVHDKVIFTLGASAEHTDICLGLSGKVFNTKEAPTPPLHWGCNSYLVPIDE